MSNKIDKLFKEKLGSRDFTPSESEWANMEHLIETQLGGDLGANATNGSISINILFSGFFILLFIGGIAISQFAPDSFFSNRETIDSAKVSANLGSIKQQKISSKKSAKNKDQSEGITSQLEEQIGQNNSLEKTAYSVKSSENEKLGQSVTAEEDSQGFKQKNKVLNESIISEQDQSSFEQNNAEKQNRKNTNYFTENSSQDAFSAKISGATNSSGLPSSNALLASITIQNSQGNSLSPAKKYDPKLNDLSNHNAINPENPPLNETYDYAREKQMILSGNTSVNSNRSVFSRTHEEFKNTLILRSIPINSLSDFGKLQSVKPFDKEPNLFVTKKQKSKRDFPIQFSIAAFGEAAWLSKKITGKSEFSTLINTRNEQEKSLLKFNGGIEFQAKYKGLGFNTGIAISSYGENLQYEEKYFSEWEISNDILIDTLWTQEIEFIYDTVYNPIDSMWVYVIVDSTFITVADSIIISNQFDSTEVLSPIGLSNQNGKTQISYWEIPLYFNYQFDLGDFYISPGLGVTIGFWKMKRGYYMAKDEVSLIPINTEYAVLRKTIINANILLGVGYKMSDEFSIEVTPSFKFNVNNVFVDDDIIQKYRSLSLQFRLRYYF